MLNTNQLHGAPHPEPRNIKDLVGQVRTWKGRKLVIISAHDGPNARVVCPSIWLDDGTNCTPFWDETDVVVAA